MAVEEAEQIVTLEALEHAVVAACLASTDVLETVAVKHADRITGMLGSLLKAADSYFTITRGLLTREALVAILAKNEPDPTKHQAYLALYDALTAEPYASKTSSDHRWYLHEYDQKWQIDQTGQSLAAAVDALRYGHEANGTKLKGAEAAWQVLAERRLEFESRAAAAQLSESEFTSSTHTATREYEIAATGGVTGIPIKIPELAGIIGGYKPGAFHIYAAYAHEGKSFFLLNDAHMAWKEGHNICVATGEMSEQEVRSRLYALHSNEPQFDHPINSENIERGNLDPAGRKVFNDVMEDLRSNPKYGKMFVFQFPYRSTPTQIFNKAAIYDQVVPLSAMFVDYVGLMASTQKRVSRREELDDLLREMRALALDFDKGRSIPCITAYQTNRQSYERARSEGYYTLSCFAECAQAEQSATSAAWLLGVQNNPDQLKVGVIKNRNGELGEPFHIGRDFKHSRIYSLQSTRGMKQQSSMTSVLDI